MVSTNFCESSRRRHPTKVHVFHVTRRGKNEPLMDVTPVTPNMSSWFHRAFSGCPGCDIQQKFMFSTSYGFDKIHVWNMFPTVGGKLCPTVGEQMFPTGGGKLFPTVSGKQFPTGGGKLFPTGEQKHFPTVGGKLFPTVV